MRWGRIRRGCREGNHCNLSVFKVTDKEGEIGDRAARSLGEGWEGRDKNKGIAKR